MLIKNRKLLIAVVAAAVFLAGAAGVYLLRGNDSESGAKDVVKLGNAGFPASAKDNKVYAVIDKYLEAQVKNERQTVLELLSTEHRAEWKDDSFLLTEIAFETFDEVKLGNVKMGVIDFQRINTKNLASVNLQYSIYFIKGDKAAARADVVEELGLYENVENWVIDRSLRSLVAAQ